MANSSASSPAAEYRLIAGRFTTLVDGVSRDGGLRALEHSAGGATP